MPGIVLKRQANGKYLTEDGNYEIGQESAITQCDAPHPVRISARTFRQIREGIDAVGVDRAPYYVLDKYNYRPIKPVVWAVYNYKKGYYCEGGEDHDYWFWYVWDIGKDDYIDNDCDSFRQAKTVLERYLSKL